MGEQGDLFVLTFIDNRIFTAQAEECIDMALLGRDIYLLTKKGELHSVSFEKGEKRIIGKPKSPAVVLIPLLRDKLITGHRDGTIRIWDLTRNQINTINAHREGVSALAVDYSGRIYSAGSDQMLKQWDVNQGVVCTVEGIEGTISHLKLYSDGKIMAVIETEGSSSGSSVSGIAGSGIGIFDFARQDVKLIPAPLLDPVSSVEPIPNFARVGVTYWKTANRMGSGSRGSIRFQSPDQLFVEM